ncbi:DNA/RNA helicase protein [Quillaja saponaria]|uniref:DNA/RNA helicase protein n=1 Tax=Quillaja saponaria TaxID=32244 RepID=A0AAD7QEF1_QUISA|nr:DNA/RNA helicase protein [Quillaja saponaria]
METKPMAEEELIKEVRSAIGSEVSESDILLALSQSENDSKVAIKFVNENSGFFTRPMMVKRTITSTGARISAQIKQEEPEESEKVQTFDGPLLEGSVKEEPDLGSESQVSEKEEMGSQQLVSQDGVEKSEAVPVSESKPSRELGSEIQVSVKEETGSDCCQPLVSQDGIDKSEAQSFSEAKPSSYLGSENKVPKNEEVCSDSVKGLAQGANSSMSFDEFLQVTNTKVLYEDEYLRTQSKQEQPMESEEVRLDQGLNSGMKLKEEPDVGYGGKVCGKEVADSESHQQQSEKSFMGEGWEDVASEKKSRKECFTPQMKQEAPKVSEKTDFGNENKVSVKNQESDSDCILVNVPNKSRVSDRSEHNRIVAALPMSSWKPSHVKEETVEDRRISTVLVEDGDFPEEPEWLLVGRTIMTAISTTKGRKLVDNEIVYFNFPPVNSRSNSQWIVRFSTKRYGEIGRLPMEWAKCIVPLVRSSKVKVQGRCIAAPSNLHMMQEIMLYISFYIHQSIFSQGGTASWRLDACTNTDSTVYPLITLFKLLNIKPYQKAEFTPAELDSRKRLLNLEGDSDEAASMLPIVKRRKGCQQYPEQNKDEQAISESTLNKLVGAAEVYNLEEMEPPSTLTCDLRPYQKQALYWMSELEKGIDVDKAAETLHPCWAAYRICDGRDSSIYVNNFSGEASTQFPTATQMILADAMGLGKTVMTIALILARPGRGSVDDQEIDSADNTGISKKRKKDAPINIPFKAKGGTLIVCPMALLSQWKDELETHSEPESISIFVHYGGDRTSDPNVISGHDVVLTTYGVLAASYKNDGENSIYHRVSWYRVVLDEAHTIKAFKTQGAQAAFKLSSHCRWCLTGTPLQNNLEDLYSLLCFLHVEPWCNWAWWNKLIQRPYENGDPRGLRLIKAILRPLMLRRTKETNDKEGRPILVLPPTDIQVIECEQSEAEHDFYDALFKRSKVQFDQFVAQGKVLHNYANILELLLRLRQCCNHPFLVMSRCDSQKYADLNKLARRFLEGDSDSASSKQTLPSRAYIEEVVEGIRRGENTECPICLESADDPVLTPCAHRMCRECLLSSWRTPKVGLCPICRKLIKKTDLITCPSDNQLRVDVEKNWKESSKITKLLDCLERIQRSGSGEKSIIFSQWTSFLDLLEIALNREGIEFLRFDGKLVQKRRERVLKEFNETKEKRVLLMSLKAGGVGLNLTAASNVFLMDPWWNPAVEEQAIMRIHRIGQKRTVSVRRFIVKNTVEERMQQVQARKQRMIAGALTDEEVRSARLEELKMLFR